MVKRMIVIKNIKKIQKINNSWVQDLVSILDQDHGPEDFLENTKLEMYADQVFCFTPKGDLIALPRGATPMKTILAKAKVTIIWLVKVN